jgi:hypothetical protein
MDLGARPFKQKLLLTHIDTAIQSVARFPIRGLSGFMMAIYLDSKGKSGFHSFNASSLSDDEE